MPTMNRWPAMFLLLLLAAAATWSSFFLVADAGQLLPAHAAGGRSCIERERDALLAFKQGINDTDDYLVSWEHESQDCCSWAGITCSNTTGHVIWLDLSGMYYLQGQISPSLLSLEHLEYLNLNNTQLTGPNGGLPEFLGSFKNLRHLDLSEMYFITGTAVPPQLGNLSKLEYLDLSYSGMYSSDISWLTRLPQLVHLDMASVNLSSITADWPLMVNMLPSLEYLSLVECSLLNANRSLTHPNLTNLQTLDLSFNYFGHPIASAWFWNKTSIKYLDLIETSLSGPFPNTLGNMTSLRQLYFGCSSDSRYLATTTCNKATMTVDLRNLCDLEELWLDGSLSSGNITEFVERLPQCPSNRLQLLSLRSNNMVGIMSDRLGQLTNLTILDLSLNNITGSIPLSIGNLFHLEYLVLSNNHLTRPIPPELGNCTSLRYINLSNNNFIGPIPLGIASGTTIEHLDLSSNSITGHIPLQTKSCTRLEHLDLSYNRITGAIPLGMGNCTRLAHLALSYNHLTGPIPPRLGNCTRLDYISLSNNLLTGIIPPQVGNYTGYVVKFREVWYVVMNREDLRYGSGIFDVVSIDLSHNLLVGGIPDGVTSLSGVMNLNLSWNHLTGKIPANIGAMKSIESLDLSRNNLSGEIPSSLSDLTFLSSLDLSYNNFEGGIPHGPQLDTIYIENPSIYTGNIGLCGPPLERNCSGDNTPEHGNQQTREKVSEPMLFLYFGLGSGFVTGIWVVFCAMMFKKAWRVAYFRLFDKLYDNAYVFVVVTLGKMNGKATS